MHIICPQCQTTLSDANVNHNANIVTCDTCYAVFSPPGDSIDGKNRKMPVQPDNISVQKRNGYLNIAYEEIAVHNRGLIVLAIVSIALMGYVIIEYFNRPLPDIVSDIVPFAGFAWSTANIILAIFGLRYLYNRVTITLDKHSLTIKNFPIRIPSTKIIGTKEIKQPFVKADKPFYGVYAKTHYGKIEAIVTGLRNPAYALFIEHQIETFLRIRDSVVEGEYTPSKSKKDH